MKTNTRFILLTCLLLCFYACDRKPYPQSLIIADSLASIQPDSAIALLKTLEDNIKTESESTQMYYRLLCIKANDKAYIRHTSDSLILLVLHYYIEKGMNGIYRRLTIMQGEFTEIWRMRRKHWIILKKQ